jgi:glycosyltransferase involved in cell wall biosynthesis
MRVAFAHDWLTGMRGGEKVLEVLCERFPDAELFTLLHVPGSVSPIIEQRPLHASFVQRLPGARRFYRYYLPLFPAAVARWDFSRFDLIVSVSHCCVKALQRPSHARHVCYCLTPMRYAWDQFDAYFGAARIGAPASAIMRPMMRRLARWDRWTADRPDRYVAISHHVAGRIDRYYNRVASVVYPPVDTNFFRPDTAAPDGYALVVSALVPYKRVDVAIDASRRAGIPLRIVGVGPEAASLQRRAAPHVEFLGRQSDEEIRALYQRAAMVLLPGEEDFGIVPLEAQACGRPVVALGRGGALETVVHGETGLLVDEPSAAAFATAMTAVRTRRFDTGVIRRHAERFSRERFGDEIEEAILRDISPDDRRRPDESRERGSEAARI